MRKNTGKENEENIINYINTKQYIDKMNSNMNLFLKSIFDFNLDFHAIKAEKFIENYKPDIIITANGISKYISVKTGKNNSIHQEHIYSFLSFLAELSTNNTTLYYLKRFHFNDGSLNGSGNKRKSANEFQLEHQNIIQYINKELNKESISSKIIDRILFNGEYYHLPTVDFIYYGTIGNGYWASKEEIKDFLKTTNIYSSAVHVSKLYYQSLHRNLKYEKYYERKRYYVQFKWYSIEKDLEYITQKRKKE